MFNGNTEAYETYRNVAKVVAEVGPAICSVYYAAKGGNGCFVAGTLVATVVGHIGIENIKEGDWVWATNPETGETALKEVVRLFRNETDEWIHVTVNGEEIICTPEHPFYSPVKGWTNAVDLRAGDILVMLNGEYVVIEQVQHELLESPEATYNFEVKDYHTYYVGNEAVLVHNKCQNHHAISNKINRAKSSNPKLNSISRNDPRFQVKALTSDAHRGYQQWHRQYDDIMVNWLNKHPNASAGEFINKLNSVYSSPNMVRRFGKVNFML